MPASEPRPSLPVMGRATRRTTIAAASALALGGCRWGPAEEPDDDPSSPDTEDTDATIAEAAAVAILGVNALLTSVIETHIGLSGALTPLMGVHAAHLDLLAPPESLGGDEVTAVIVSASQAMSQVRRDEFALQQQLARLAGEAASGDLARALASMSASIAQHLVDLPQLAKGPA